MLLSDTCGLISVLVVYISYAIFCYVGIFIGLVDLYEDPEILISIFIALVFLSLICHTTAMLADPGTITSTTFPITQEGIPCTVCYCVKPPRAHHCVTCGKCILNMDHHCPWINNCVGFRNQKHFIQFLVYTLLASSMFLVIIFHKIIICQAKECFTTENPFDVILIMISSF